MIRSPSTFKTCWIAEAMEELGLPVRTAPNRRASGRKVKAPPEKKRLLKEAILSLQKEGKVKPTYKEVQQRAFELYRTHNKPSVLKFYGRVKADKGLVTEVLQDEGLIYE